MTKRDGVIGEIPKAPEGEFLSAEQMSQLAPAANHRRDTPEGEIPICAYCGAETSMFAWTNMGTGNSYPACCYRNECMDKLEPLK